MIIWNSDENIPFDQIRRAPICFKCLKEDSGWANVVKKDGPNKGRQFSKCESCNFFQFIHPTDAEASRYYEAYLGIGQKSGTKRKASPYKRQKTDNNNYELQKIKADLLTFATEISFLKGEVAELKKNILGDSL